jgi:hypothetical protein
MADVTKRVNYFDRQFLRAADLQAEQAYGLDRRRRHNRLLHGPGVAEGLQVSGNVGDPFVTVSPGTAYDASGQEIVLAASQQVPVSSVSGGTAFITIAYGEQQSDPSADPGSVGSTRISEMPALAAGASSPTSPNITLLLAKVSLSSGKVSAAPDNSVRTQAGGLQAQDVTFRTVTLRNDQASTANLPKLSASASGNAVLQNGSLMLDPSHELFFADSGQIRSLDDTHRLVFNHAGGALELREAGDIVLMTGNPPSEKMRVTKSGSVGIGAPSPDSNLAIQSSGGAILTLKNGDTGGGEVALGVDTNGGILGTITSHDLQLRTQGQTRMIIQKDGRVAVGLAAPAAGFQMDVAGTLHAATLQQGSDERLKKDMRPIADALAKVECVRGVTFEWNDAYAALGMPARGREVGLIAQDVQKVCPEIVMPWQQGYLSLDYGRMAALLVEAVKELATQNRRLEQRVKALESELGVAPPERAVAAAAGGQHAAGPPREAGELVGS